MDDALHDAIAAAVRLHEIGDGDPYRLSFAGKGRSGASFGALQGDAGASSLARDTLKAILAAAAIAPAEIDALMAVLAAPCSANPLSAADDRLVAAALAAPAGHSLVDAMDRQILAGLCASVDECCATAQAAKRAVEPKATVYMALWINMSGPPTTLKFWLAGNDVWLDRHATRVAAPGATVSVAAIEDYLQATDYFAANPHSFAALQLAAASETTLA
jgi:hypothetical protein